MPTTTIGKALVNRALPPGFSVDALVLGKKEADDLLGAIARANPDMYRDVSVKLQRLGADASFDEATTLALDDTFAPFDKSDLLRHVDEQENAIDSSGMTDEEKSLARESVYSQVQGLFTRQTVDSATAAGNPFAMQVKSKARGNPSQLAALMTTPSVYHNPSGQMIPVFIRHSYAEGLDPHEYWAATYGARSGVVSTKMMTAKAGYLGKLLGGAVRGLVVTDDDCHTPYGVPMPVDSEAIGSLLSRQVGGFPPGTPVTKEVLAQARKQGLEDIVVRSPMTCATHSGVCRHCVGIRESGELPEIGYHAGLNASSAVAERVAQALLNAKHTGGQKSHESDDYSGFNIVRSLVEVPGTFPHRSMLSEADGAVESISEAPQGGWHVTVGGQDHYVPPEMRVLVAPGDEVERGDQLSSGLINPADVVRLKGIGEGRRYFATRFTKALRDSGLDAHRRNVEVLARGIVDHVDIDDPAGVGSHLPGETATYSSVAHGYRPRGNSSSVPVAKAAGMYLEQPVLHHTIGTRLSGRAAAELGRHGVSSVLVNSDPPGFTPHMQSIVKAPSFSDDWMARLSSNYLKDRLLADVHRGSVSSIHGVNPVPGMARAVEFGEWKGRDFRY